MAAAYVRMLEVQGFNMQTITRKETCRAAPRRWPGDRRTGYATLSAHGRSERGKRLVLGKDGDLAVPLQVARATSAIFLSPMDWRMAS